MLRARDSRGRPLLLASVLLTCGGCELVSGLSSLKVQAKAPRADASTSASAPDAATNEDAGDSGPVGSLLGTASATPDASTASSAASADAAADASPDARVPGPVVDAAIDSGPSPSATAGEGGLSLDGSACTPPENSSCDPVDGCGCSTDERCTYGSGPAPVAECFTPGAIVPPYSACADSIDCSEGHYCHEGVCVRACRTEVDCAQSAALCLTDSEIAGASYCTSGCDPLDPSPADAGRACGDGATCILVQGPEGAGLFSECVIPTDTRGVGAACETAAQCELGLTCLDEACAPLCAVGGDECPRGSLCELHETRFGVDVGVCTIPACDVSDTNPCAVLPFSCGCDDGQQCQLVNSTGGTACKDIGTEATCGTDADCTLGTTCIPSKDRSSDSLCLPYCDETWPCAEGACSPIPWDNGEFAGGYCGGACDPFDVERDDESVTPCPVGQHCGALFGDASLGSECSASTGPVAVGDSCAFSPDCEDGAGCACDDGLDCRESSYNGVCLAYCKQDADCSGPYAQCLDLGYAEKMCVDFPTGTSNCSLSPPWGCDAPSSCVEVASDGTTACLTNEQEACSYTEYCAAGLLCASGLCRPECSVNNLCTESQQCSSEPLAEGGTAEVCLGRCDPVDPFLDDALFTPCGLGAVCLRGDPLGIEGSACVPAGADLPFGAACVEDADCSLGLACDQLAYDGESVVPACTIMCRDDYECQTIGENWACDTGGAAGWGYDEYDRVGVCFDVESMPPETDQ